MNRLLQGDVGSGKLVVAGLVAAEVAQAGFQTITKATEILAAQHAKTLDEAVIAVWRVGGSTDGARQGRSAAAAAG